MDESPISLEQLAAGVVIFVGLIYACVEAENRGYARVIESLLGVWFLLSVVGGFGYILYMIVF